MRSVLVTGGTTRLGLAIAERLRADGWRVIASSHRADSGADIVADLSEPLGAAKLYAACLRLLGGNPPDALVNNAALFAGDDAALEAVNLVAPQKLTMLMAGRETGRGAVVNILDCRVLCGAEVTTTSMPSRRVLSLRRRRYTRRRGRLRSDAPRQKTSPLRSRFCSPRARQVDASFR